MANSRQEKIARYKEQKEQEKRIKVKNSVFFCVVLLHTILGKLCQIPAQGKLLLVFRERITILNYF